MFNLPIHNSDISSWARLSVNFSLQISQKTRAGLKGQLLFLN